jgi:hypothetical protein
MKLEKDQDTWFLALVAMRYCIGRRSYAPSLCAQWIKRHWPIIPTQTRAMMRRDLADECGRADHTGNKGMLGDACDELTWRDLLEWMVTRPEGDYTP